MLIDTLIARKTAVERKSSKSASGRDHLFSLLKGVSWRVVGTIDTIIISYLVTGQIHMALSIGSIEVFTKIALFYFHDRAWELAKSRKNNTKNENGVD